MSTGSSEPATEDRISDTIWYGSLITAALALGGIMIVLLIVLSGAADPQPVGDLQIDDTTLDPQSWPDLISLSEGQSGFELDPPWTIDLIAIVHPLSVPGTLEVSMRQIAGPSAAAYGLAWAGAEGTTIVIKVNVNGYLGITRTLPDGAVDDIYTWRPFPHVRGVNQSNRIRVTFNDGQALARINDEVAAEFDNIPDGLYHLSWYAETFEEGGLQIAIERFRLWAEQ